MHTFLTILACVLVPQPFLWLAFRAGYQLGHAKGAELEEANLDMENTINAISDPDDYEIGGEKTVETCRRLATECGERNHL